MLLLNPVGKAQRSGTKSKSCCYHVSSNELLRLVIKGQTEFFVFLVHIANSVYKLQCLLCVVCWRIGKIAKLRPLFFVEGFEEKNG